MGDESGWSFCAATSESGTGLCLALVLRLFLRYFCAAARAYDSTSAWLMRGIAGSLQNFAEFLLHCVRLLFTMGLANFPFEW